MTAWSYIDVENDLYLKTIISSNRYFYLKTDGVIRFSLNEFMCLHVKEKTNFIVCSLLKSVQHESWGFDEIQNWDLCASMTTRKIWCIYWVWFYFHGQKTSTISSFVKTTKKSTLSSISLVKLKTNKKFKSLKYKKIYWKVFI